MLKLATVVLSVMLVYAAIYGVLEMAVPHTIEGITFEAVTGESLENLREAGYLQPYLMVGRHMGLFALCLVVAVAFTLFAGFRKGERWAWWAILLVSGPAWLWGFVDSLIIGATINFLLHLVGVVLLGLGLFLPFRSFFGYRGTNGGSK
jgi:hypothetical protein